MRLWLELLTEMQPKSSSINWAKRGIVTLNKGGHKKDATLTNSGIMRERR